MEIAYHVYECMTGEVDEDVVVIAQFPRNFIKTVAQFADCRIVVEQGLDIDVPEKTAFLFLQRRD